MPKGLTKKLDFEKARAKGRRLNTDYRDRFASEGEEFDRGGSHGARITLTDAARVKPAIVKIRSEEKVDAINFYESEIRGRMLKIGQWRFRFKITPTQFAKENEIPIQQCNEILPGLQNKAGEFLRMTLNRARNATLQRSEHGFLLCFKTFLRPVAPIEWRRIYKKVLICPSEDCDE